MDAHVGANGPGAMGKSNLTSGVLMESPNGTLSGGNDLEISGSGGSGGNGDFAVQPARIADITQPKATI
jgi:hypothetical protein